MAEDGFPDTASLSILVPLWKKCLSSSFLERRWFTVSGAREVVLLSVKEEEVCDRSAGDIKVTLTFSAVTGIHPNTDRRSPGATCEILLLQVSSSEQNACFLVVFRCGTSAEQRYLWHRNRKAQTSTANTHE